jgi:hypothetical protein
MTKDQFRASFQAALSHAAGAASVPAAIECHGNADIRTLDEAVDWLWLGPDRFYRVIDVAMRGDVAFVRVSGHGAGGWDETWEPAGLGPFKVLEAPDDACVAITQAQYAR